MKEYIRNNEGLRLFPYLCPAGHLTIGYGINLDEGITPEEAAFLFESRFKRAYQAARELVPGFDDLSEARQTVLVDMAYNLGKAGLWKFQKMLAAIKEGDFERAAAELADSLYYNQVPTRARKNREMLRNG